MKRVVWPAMAGMALWSLAGCGAAPQPAKEAPKAAAVKPADQSHRLPKDGLVSSGVVETPLLDKAFMPGGTLGKYKQGKVEYEVFLAQAKSAEGAALAMLDWKNALKDARFVGHFGGYSGSDNGRPVFVFAKNTWIAGVVGLAEKDADKLARDVAARLN